MLKMMLIKLALVFCAMLNLAFTTERTCEKRAYDLMQGCKGVAYLTGCLRDLLPQMGGCDEAEQLLGLAEKVKPQSCEQKAEGIKGRCQGSSDQLQCLTDAIGELQGCPKAEELLGLTEHQWDPSEWTRLSCQERAERMKTMCDSVDNKDQCLKSGLVMMPDCQDAARLLGIEGHETISCEEKANHMKQLCDPADNKEQCLLSALLTMTSCPEAARLLGIDGHGGWSEMSCEDRAGRMRALCEQRTTTMYGRLILK